jgi:hypothetical protein
MDHPHPGSPQRPHVDWHLRVAVIGICIEFGIAVIVLILTLRLTAIGNSIAEAALDRERKSAAMEEVRMWTSLNADVHRQKLWSWLTDFTVEEMHVLLWEKDDPGRPALLQRSSIPEPEIDAAWDFFAAELRLADGTCEDYYSGLLDQDINRKRIGVTMSVYHRYVLPMMGDMAAHEDFENLRRFAAEYKSE